MDNDDLLCPDCDQAGLRWQDIVRADGKPGRRLFNERGRPHECPNAAPVTDAPFQRGPNRQLGFSCPECSAARTQVLETRSRNSMGTIFRRRECANGHRFSTQEIVVKEMA